MKRSRSHLRRRWVVRLLLIAAVLVPTGASAGGPEGDTGKEAERETADAPGLFLGEEYRYDKKGVLERTAHNLVAIPAGMADWRADQWAIFGGVMAPSFALMAPTDPSPDARIDRWAQEAFDPWFPDIWDMKYQGPFWAVLGFGGFGTWGVAAATDRPRLAESMSMMAEAVATSQIYHLSLKLLTGREGPRMAEGRGIFHGPARSLELFPAGTPSGHFATLYSMFGAAQTYWQFPLAWDITGHAVIGSLAASHVITHRHFLSEIIVGSAMGYAISQWVVHHRSTRYEYRDGRAVRVAVVPQPRGIALSFQITVD